MHWHLPEYNSTTTKKLRVIQAAKEAVSTKEKAGESRKLIFKLHSFKYEYLNNI